MVRDIAIIGDHFILPEMFEKELRKVCPHEGLNCRLRLEDWPNSPVNHGYSGDPDILIKECIGRCRVHHRRNPCRDA